MRILIVGLNYTPEPIGIGPYTAGLARHFAAAGHQIAVVAGNPYYPEWRLAPGFAQRRSDRSEDGVQVVRVPHYIPRQPTGPRRIAHHLSFARSAFGPALALAASLRPRVVIAVAPSLLAAPVALAAARRAGAASWLHIQDFEVEAAMATGLIGRGPLASLAGRIESAILSRFDTVTAISGPMIAKALTKGAPRDNVRELRNWADTPMARRDPDASPMRRELRLPPGPVVLYSGNLALKQGVGLIADAAEHLSHRKDIQFVVCGEGSGKQLLESRAKGLPNLHLRPLQPRERLGELLALADLHILPQIADAADLVLPSKLTNMLASGRPVVATAADGTALAEEVEGCGMVVPPGDSRALAAAVVALCDDAPRRRDLGRAAKQRAAQRWSKPAILAQFDVHLGALGKEAA